MVYQPFPSPCGEKVGINGYSKYRRKELLLEVSVPLRGKGRDQQMYILASGFEKSFSKFPSPCGEKVGINKEHPGEIPGCVGGGFPSPCGEKVGINFSVFSNQYGSRFGVSVPLRGKGRDQRARKVRRENLYALFEFPSPCGEKVGINQNPVVSLRNFDTRFPSPCGEKVGINTA